jgi:hypothetical protein
MSIRIRKNTPIRKASGNSRLWSCPDDETDHMGIMKPTSPMIPQLATEKPQITANHDHGKAV